MAEAGFRPNSGRSSVGEPTMAKVIKGTAIKRSLSQSFECRED